MPEGPLRPLIQRTVRRKIMKLHVQAAEIDLRLAMIAGAQTPSGDRWKIELLGIQRGDAIRREEAGGMLIPRLEVIRVGAVELGCLIRGYDRDQRTVLADAENFLDCGWQVPKVFE